MSNSTTLAARERAADQRHELAHRVDVLERVPADHRVAGEVGVALGVEVADPASRPGRSSARSGTKPGSIPTPSADAELHQQLQELALAAADLEHLASRGGRSGRPSAPPARCRNSTNRGENACVSSYEIE